MFRQCKNKHAQILNRKKKKVLIKVISSKVKNYIVAIEKLYFSKKNNKILKEHIAFLEDSFGDLLLSTINQSFYYKTYVIAIAFIQLVLCNVLRFLNFTLLLMNLTGRNASVLKLNKSHVFFLSHFDLITKVSDKEKNLLR